MVFKNLILILNFNAYRIYKTDKKGVARYLNFSMMIEGSVLFTALYALLMFGYICRQCFVFASVCFIDVWLLFVGTRTQW